jgi:hypothetical protein
MPLLAIGRLAYPSCYATSIAPKKKGAIDPTYNLRLKIFAAVFHSIFSRSSDVARA